MAGIPLSHKQISRASGDLVLFDKNSLEPQSAVFEVIDYSYVAQAYGLKPGEQVVLYSVYRIDNLQRQAIFSYKGNSIILTYDKPTALIAISGMYKFIFAGILGSLTLALLPQKDIKKDGSRPNAAGLYSDKERPNTLFKGASLFSTTIQVTEKPLVLSVFGLIEFEEVRILSAYGEETFPYTINGFPQKLDIENTSLVLDRSGFYILEKVNVTSDIDIILRPNYVSYADPYLSQGIEGPPGPPSPGSGFNFVQPTPALTWVINHNLGYYPAVELLSVGGVEFQSEVVHLSTNTVQIQNKIAVAGRARLN